MRINTAKELEVYQASYQLAMEIFELSKSFPSDEKYALTSQIRRSSRSVPMNLREAWSKRRYEAHFINCGYITQEHHTSLVTKCDSIRRMLGSMLNNPTPFLLKL
jgi:hypothetical protein